MCEGAEELERDGRTGSRVDVDEVGEGERE